MRSSVNGGSVFVRLRQRARSSFVGKHRLDVIVHGRLADGPKYVSLSVLKSAFAVAGLLLVEEEAEYLVKRFADNRRRIDWGRLLVALDVGAPADFTDPDRSFVDDLPQPYRLIVGVLDTEVVDRAWAVIVERHPELDTSPADEARAAADIDLGRSCPPSVRLQHPHPPLLLHGRNVEYTPSTEVKVAMGKDQGEDSPLAGRVGNRAVNEEPSILQVANEITDGISRDGGACQSAPATPTHEGRASVTAVQWDQQGEMMFTGGQDGSICLRINGILEEIAVQIGSLGGGTCPETNTERETPAAVALLSRPVGALRGQSTRPTSVRIAVILAPFASESNGDSLDNKITNAGTGGEGKEESVGDSSITPVPTRSTHFVAVLEVALPNWRAGGEAGHGRPMSGAFAAHETFGGDDDPDAADNKSNNRSSKKNGNTKSRRPTFRVICTIKLEHKDVPITCALSPDGRRLALTTAGGVVATWMLPLFAPPSGVRCPSSTDRQTFKGRKHDHAYPATAEEGDGRGESQESHDVDGGASVDGSRTSSCAGHNDLANRAKVSSLPAGSTGVETATPLQLGKAEFSIPHLKSPEELAYDKALQEYSRRVKAGEIQEPASAPGALEAEDGGSTPPPEAPQLSGDAHHLTHAEFVPPNVGGGGGGGGGALSIWRSQSNVLRLYRLPAPPRADDKGQQRQEDEESGVEGAQKVFEATNGAGNGGGEDVDQTGDDSGSHTCSLLEAELDISTLPSAEWVLPSPITAVAVSEEGGDEAGREWSCCGDPKRPALPLAPLVAVGTANGGVYLCDGALCTAREGLSRHRARVTALAFHGKRFVVSGSDDEMIQIHHVSVAAATGGGGASCAGGTPRLRCLHYARGSGIVRIECLHDTPLMLAEDTSGRMVVYDLLSGTVLGVLALRDSSSASKTTTKSNAGNDGVDAGGAPSSERAISPGNAGIVWASGGNYIAAVLPREEDQEGSSTRSSNTLRAEAGAEYAESGGGGGGGGALGVWSAADMMWGLSPGMRNTAGGERPLGSKDATRLFYDLLPAQRKDAEAKSDFRHLPLPSSPPSTGQEENQFGRRATPPPTTASSTKTSFQRSSVKQGVISRQVRPALTEGNVDRMFAANGVGCPGAPAFGGGTRGADSDVGEGTPWVSEMGAVERVRRYMAGRHGERAARQIRLDNVTRNLLHAM